MKCLLFLISAWTLVPNLIAGNPNLYKYGLDASDSSIPRDRDDISSPEVRLAVPIVFYGQRHASVYVNQNGLISFLIEVPTFVNIQFPLDYPSIAAFYTDVDTRIAGSIYYRETRSENSLAQAHRFLAEKFSSARNFLPKSLFIATWDGVGSFDRKSDKLNTFQLVIASDGDESYAIFNYDRIEWIQGTGKNPSMPDAKAQAGFISGNGPHFSLKGSGTDQAFSIHKRSNVGQPGVWAFRVGRVTDTPQEPDMSAIKDMPETSTSCDAGGAAICHSRAVCVDYSPGFCCQCAVGYYGNGKTCFENAIPQRAVGKVRGVLNGIAINDADLYSYVVPADGRAYTAIAKINDRLGYEFQALPVIGAIFGWLFSIQVKGAPNGFQVTGGVLNYTADVSFVQTGHKVTITQAYTGLDVFNQLMVDTRIHGTTSVVPVGNKIEVNDFDLLLTRVSAGLIRSKSNHKYRINGTSSDYPFTIEQTIAYEECAFASPFPSETTKVKVGKSYIDYDATQDIIRYAITSTTSPPDGEDPCKKATEQCPQLSSCVADGTSFKCICNLGYEEEYVEGNEEDGPYCIDVDECRTGTSDCDVAAHCINKEGSYLCNCTEGYVGDGRTCAKSLTCADVQCGQNARCAETKPGEPECICSTGFKGDGLFCLPQNGDDNENENEEPEHYCASCDRNADCNFDPSTNGYICQCRDGLVEDGRRCSQPTATPSPDPEVGTSDCLDIELCHPYADCLQVPNRLPAAHHCACRFPFVGDGYKDCKDSRIQSQTKPAPAPECTFNDRCWCPPEFDFDELRHQCVPKAEETPKSCEQDPTLCDLNARCVSIQSGTPGECVCNSGYHGDGQECLPQDLCARHSDCSADEDCVYNRTELRYRCECKSGFSFDGSRCRLNPEVGCDVTRNCDTNARCVWDPNQAKYQCECKPGFLGTGFQCQEDMNGCNVLNNCARNAECSYNPEQKRFDCRCREGFDGDGTNCRSTTRCYQDPTVCDVNAECRPNHERREWMCHCKLGYAGDGFDCHEARKRDSQFLLVAKGMALIKVFFNAERPQPMIIEPFQTAIGLDIDCPNERVYWSDVGGRMIKSSYFNGSDKTSFIAEDIGSPEGLSVDWPSQNLYWTDSTKDTIEVANLVTKKRKTLISTDLVNPRGIAVYPQRGRLYWTDWNRNRPKIEFSGMDGLGRQIFIGEGLSLPNSLVIDVASDKLCFADAGTRKIDCVGIDGRGRRTFVSGIKYPFGLAIGSETFYWSDWNTTFIEQASRRNGVMGKSLDVSLGGPGKLYGIVLVPEICPQVHSPCNPNECPGDDYICLPNIRGARSCRCGDDASTNCKEIL